MRATAREWRRPGLSPSREKLPGEKPRTGRCQDLEETSGGIGRDTEAQRDPHRANTPGADRYLGAGQGRQRVECTGMRTAVDAGTRHEAQVQAAEADGWWVAGNAPVFGASHRERRWGAGEKWGFDK